MVNAITSETARAYAGKRCLVTGGMGFIGSNLAIALAEAGAHVTVLDSHAPGCGANRENLSGYESIEILHADIADCVLPAKLDVVFNLAGEISHAGSMTNPRRDLSLNAASQLAFLEQLSRQSPCIRVVFASTRQVYGVPQSLPVDENHPVLPVDYNGVHKFAAEHYHALLSRLGRIDAIMLRLSNVYGPRQALQVPGQGFLGVFLRRALQGEPIVLFGDGSQLRDPLYVSDAVAAFLHAGAVPSGEHRVFNIGSGQPVSLARIADILTGSCNLPPVENVPFPASARAIDIGDYCSCVALAAEELNWLPSVGIEDGLTATLAFYRSGASGKQRFAA